MLRQILKTLAALAFAALLLFTLLYNGIIWFTDIHAWRYQVRGVDVSNYQGEIDWTVLAGQGIDFAFIKATEGSTFQDKKFGYNLAQAYETDLRVGAYHFFSYDSSGETQAENFINTVPKLDNLLPPVIDIEFYGDKDHNPPSRQQTESILRPLLETLEQHYGKKPIIYAVEKSYDLYISGDYQEYPIWIRDVIEKPVLSDGRQWTFWQYCARKTLKGYKGEERFIDMNVFAGTLEELMAM